MRKRSSTISAGRLNAVGYTSCRWPLDYQFATDRIFLMTSGSSIKAMIRTAPPQARQVSMSIPNTRFRHCAHVTDARRSAGVGSSPSPVAAR